MFGSEKARWLLVFSFTLYGMYTCSHPVDTNPAIVSKVKLADGAECVDYTGNTMGHLDEWPTTAGKCDNNVCFHAISGKFIIMQSCPDLTDYLQLKYSDSNNCRLVEDSGLQFPRCCPQVECDERPILSTSAPLSCSDIANNRTCSIWYDLTGGCLPNFENSGIYNYTVDFCRKTCGFC